MSNIILFNSIEVSIIQLSSNPNTYGLNIQSITGSSVSGNVVIDDLAGFSHSFSFTTTHTESLVNIPKGKSYQVTFTVEGVNELIFLIIHPENSFHDIPILTGIVALVAGRTHTSTIRTHKGKTIIQEFENLKTKVIVDGDEYPVDTKEYIKIIEFEGPAGEYKTIYKDKNNDNKELLATGPGVIFKVS